MRPVVEIVSMACTAPGGGGPCSGTCAAMHDAPTGKPEHENMMVSKPGLPSPLTEKGKLPFWPAVTVTPLKVGSGIKVKSAASPTKAIVTGFTAPVFATVIAPFWGPATWGVNVMLTVQLSPCAAKAPQLLVCEKPGPLAA